MEKLLFLALGALLLIGAIALEAYMRKGKHRPLSRIGSKPRKTTQPGTEAIDKEAFDAAVSANQQIARRTGAFTRPHGHADTETARRISRDRYKDQT